jgi:hypothetical protein
MTIGRAAPLSSLAGLNFENSFVHAGQVNSITTHKGVDVYEVFWSADVTTSRDLRRPSIDDIRHGEPTWEQIT